MSGRKEEDLGANGQAISEFGAVLRAWRRQRDYSVTDLALQAGFGVTGRSYISKIEHGLIRHISEERLERIAAALGVSATDLLAKRWPGHTPTNSTGQSSVDPWEIAGRLRRGGSSQTANSPQISKRLSSDLPREGNKIFQSALQSSAPSDHADTHPSSTRPTRPMGPSSASSAEQRQDQAAEQQSANELLSTLDAQIRWRIDAAMSHLEVALLSELRRMLQEEFRPLVTQIITQAVLEATQAPVAATGEHRQELGHWLPLSAETGRS